MFSKIWKQKKIINLIFVHIFKAPTSNFRAYERHRPDMLDLQRGFKGSSVCFSQLYWGRNKVLTLGYISQPWLICRWHVLRSNHSHCFTYDLSVTIQYWCHKRFLTLIISKTWPHCANFVLSYFIIIIVLTILKQFQLLSKSFKTGHKIRGITLPEGTCF